MDILLHRTVGIGVTVSEFVALLLVELKCERQDITS